MNRKWFQLWNIARLRGKLLDILALGRTMLLLAGGSLVFFMLLGAGGVAGQKLNPSPLPSMKGLAASLSSGFFVELLGMEVPHLPKGEEPSSFSASNISAFALRMLTSIDPEDPKSLVAREVPGMAADNPFLLRKGSGGSSGAPADYHPGTDELAAGDEAGEDQHSTDGTVEADEPQVTSAPPEAAQTPEPAGNGGTAGGNAADNGAAAAQGTSVKRVLIYHSHPREAYNPLLGAASDNPSSASPSQNVLLVGSYITEQLEKRGIGTVHAQDDYATQVPDYNWNYSYKYSRITVKAVMAANDELTELIDIHRDSQRHGKTTAVIDGQSYAQVYFILGHANKDWKQNEKFANQIHQKLENEYPGLSRGIWGKSSGNGNNGEYNQSLSPNSVLIEVGGIDNTDEELKRTAGVLADAIADVYWENQGAEKASASGEAAGQKPAAMAPTENAQGD